MTAWGIGHHCHARCGRPCQPKYLCCPTCWRFVPKALGREVFAHFMPAQCTDAEDRPNPTGRWELAATAALLTVALRRSTLPPEDPKMDNSHLREKGRAYCQLRMRGSCEAALHTDMERPEVVEYLGRLCGLLDRATKREAFAPLSAAMQALMAEYSNPARAGDHG